MKKLIEDQPVGLATKVCTAISVRANTHCIELRPGLVHLREVVPPCRQLPPLLLNAVEEEAADTEDENEACPGLTTGMRRGRRRRRGRNLLDEHSMMAQWA
jgi:hypothetical protein